MLIVKTGTARTALAECHGIDGQNATTRKGKQTCSGLEIRNSAVTRLHPVGRQLPGLLNARLASIDSKAAEALGKSPGRV
jgi:hypothetical protein